MTPSSMWGLVEERAAATPDAPMLLDQDDRRLTFAQFRDQAEATAAGLASLGVGPGSVVAWQLPTRIESVLIAYGLARLGARQVPLIPIYRHREVGFVLRQATPTHVVVPQRWRGFDLLAMAEELAAELDHPLHVVLDEDVPRLPAGNLPTFVAPGDDIRWTYYTSGTTSAPKGVRHTDHSLLAGAESLAVAWGAVPGDVVHMAMPFAHIAGPDVIGAALFGGFTLTLSDGFVPEEAVKQCRRHGVTHAGGSTAYYLGFLQEQRKRPGEKVVPTLRGLFGGGAPSSPAIFQAVLEEMDVHVIHGYGMTECPMITQGTLRDTDEQLAHTDGHPVRHAEVRIADDGEICVRGGVVFAGYTDPELDAFDDDGWFHTGDVGHLRDDGHLVLTGRLKDIIIRKGENVSAKDVEDVIYEHPDVLAVAVIGLPDEERGELVCAVVELRDPAANLTLPALHEHCRAAGMMVQKIPERLEVVDELPRNATLKILKTELRARYGGN